MKLRLKRRAKRIKTPTTKVPKPLFGKKPEDDEKHEFDQEYSYRANLTKIEND